MSSNTVYVTGLPSSATQDDIMDFFTRIGNVAEVVMPAADSAAPVAVVFDKPEDAASAVSITGSDFQEDIPIHISAHGAPETTASTAASERAADEQEATASADGEGAAAERAGGRRAHRDDPHDITNKVVVSNLAPFTERKMLRDVFGACGEIDDFVLMARRHMAFVGFTTAEAFEKALQLDGTVVNGARVKVERRHGSSFGTNAEGGGRRNGGDKPNSAANPPLIPNRIVVRNVPADVNKEGLRAFFAADCGAPTDIYVKPESGIAFLAFNTGVEADKAIAKSGQEYGGSVIQIERRQVLVCRRCGKEGHKGANCRQPYCSECRMVGHSTRECPRRRGGRGGDRRRRRSSSSLSSASSDRDRRRRRHRSDSSDRDHRRRRHSRSRSPPRRRRHSRSRSPPRGRR
jgi:RNA recognition motif-containing protein